MTATLIELVGGPLCGDSVEVTTEHVQFAVQAHDGKAIYNITGPGKARFICYQKEGK